MKRFRQQAAVTTAPPAEPDRQDDRLEELLPGPAEGWLALGALVVMAVVTALAIDGARWAGVAPDGRTSATSFLPLAALASVLLGTLLAKMPIGTLRAHLLAATVGGVYIVVSLSTAISSLPTLELRLRALNASVSTWVDDVVVVGIRSAEISVFLLVIGALVWGAGHFAAYSVFRRRRPVPALAMIGLLLLVNVSITALNQFAELVVFASAALLLLVRIRLLEEMREWRAKGMLDPVDTSAAFLRGGAVFVALAVVGSIALAANASSAPLNRAWRDLDQRMLEVGFEVNRWLGGVSGEARGPSVLFTPTQTIRDSWVSSEEIVFTATTSDGSAQYWRGAAYDSFDGRTWQQSDRHTEVIEAGDDPLALTADAITDPAGRREISATVTPRDFGGRVFVAPEGLSAVDQPSEVITHGPGGTFIAGALPGGFDPEVPYSVTALVREEEGEVALTGNQLAGAGVVYPESIRRFIEIRDGSVGALVYATSRDIYDSLPRRERNPYHFALAVQQYLFQTGGFRYQTDIRGLCGAEKVADCMLRIKRGYCEQFATTMVMMLRTQQVPARYVVGYLPGRELADGSREVARAAAHAWVEVYFPGYGWIRFDPTPGNAEQGQTPTTLPDGPELERPDEPPAEPPAPVFLPEPDDDLGPDRGPIVGPVRPGEGGGGGSDQPLGLAIAMAIIVGLALLAALAVLLRSPRAQPEIAYRGVARLARRLGHGPQPAQTVYEFTDGLATLVPPVHGDLRLIATAKVEATYAGRPVSGSIVDQLTRAYRRVRVGLLRLLFRREGRAWLPRGPRGPREASPSDWSGHSG